MICDTCHAATNGHKIDVVSLILEDPGVDIWVIKTGAHS